ncbi:MAG TPA: DUF4350 domain-containing protein [Chitinophagaceae bacterium]
MKKLLPYGLIILVIGVLGGLLLTSSRNRPKRMDERISLRQKDKIPYGFYAARNLVPSLFPKAAFYTDKRAPGLWDSLSLTAPNQAVVLVANTMNADSRELEDLVDFARMGNHVFIITKYLSYEANNFFGFSTGDIYSEDGLQVEADDSLKVKLSAPRFGDTLTYTYPGKRHATFYSNWDKDKAVVLGSNGSGYPNFLQFRAGKGAIYVHTAPLAFSNYFVLHKNNVRYLEQAFSVLPRDINRIVWSEYYLTKPGNQPQKEPSMLSVLFRYPSFKWAFITAIIALLLYVAMEMRRKQRVIPVVQSPRNDSLDFVQTIGRLYYDKKDHGDLARKMSVYFLDHVRSQYKLPTHTLDESFVHALHAKSGYGIDKVKSLLQSIEHVNTARSITDTELTQFHNQLESFYQNT